MIEAVELYYNGAQQKIDTAKTSSSPGSSIISSKFLSDSSISGNRTIQRQSVVTILADKQQYVKVINSQLFRKTPLEIFIEELEEKHNNKEGVSSREEYKHSKVEHKSFIQGQKCHIHRKSSMSCFF